MTWLSPYRRAENFGDAPGSGVTHVWPPNVVATSGFEINGIIFSNVLAVPRIRRSVTPRWSRRVDAFWKFSTRGDSMLPPSCSLTVHCIPALEGPLTIAAVFTGISDYFLIFE
jgi:hypothetical protein